MRTEKQQIIKGSSFLLDSSKLPFDRIKYMTTNMQENYAFVSYIKKNKVKIEEKIKLLENFKKKFQEYRINWKKNPQSAYLKKSYEEFNPLCLDIETAAICDLACPHCYREYILTPDKIMSFELFISIINEAIKLNVPSVKLNWRGEPLLNPNLEKFIKYAKENGILEVSINTNATHLTKERAEAIINSGLDLIIFSFDGGSKETYEKMRPSRFNKNSFEAVYSNIKNFCEIKKINKKKFPVTKIQMVLTNETRNEVESFFNLFSNYVDDVTVTPYTERGGNFETLDKKLLDKVDKYLSVNKMSKNTKYFADVDGKINIAINRKPCEQLFQRLMITYDGRVAMCCHDWGAQHCLGYIDKKAFKLEATLVELEKKIKANKKGFELLKNASRQKNYNTPIEDVQSLQQLWTGKELTRVRNLHAKKKLNEIEICKNCDFKDTYEWIEID